MNDPYRGPLIIWKTGQQGAEPVLLMHDRFQDESELAALADSLGQDRQAVRVRSPRTQMEDTRIKGYYWFFGPPERPELSTLGDGLFHLETLILHLADASPSGKLALVGKGEGGVMALILAQVWPERISRVVSIDGGLPDNSASFPVDLKPAPGLPALLIRQTGDLAATATALAANGWAVESSDDPARITGFLSLA